jgi:hypothetical protein
MNSSSANASSDAAWSSGSSATIARQASDDTTSVGRKCFAANVDLPEPLAPIRSTSENAGRSRARDSRGSRRSPITGA